MKKIDKLIASLKNMLIEFRSVNTDKAVLSWDGEDELQEGVAVYVKDEEGNNLVPEDGEYVAEDKITYVVENGIVKEVIPAPDEEPAEEQPEAPAEEPAEEAPAEEPAEEPVDEPAEEPAEEPEPEPEPEPEAPVEEIVEEANKLEETVNSLVEKVDALVAEIEELKAFKVKVEGMSAAMPAQEQFNQFKGTASKDKEIQAIGKFFD